MSKIQVMSMDLSNKIAAGEVIEKTMNVVKELVENSIDAGATTIKIDLLDSGVGEIIVTDDGVGMDREDAPLAFSLDAMGRSKDNLKATMLGTIIRTTTLFLFSLLKIGLYGYIISTSIHVIFVTIYNSSQNFCNLQIYRFEVDFYLKFCQQIPGSLKIVLNSFYNKFINELMKVL